MNYHWLKDLSFHEKLGLVLDGTISVNAFYTSQIEDAKFYPEHVVQLKNKKKKNALLKEIRKMHNALQNLDDIVSADSSI